jgi:putative transposase
LRRFFKKVGSDSTFGRYRGSGRRNMLLGMPRLRRFFVPETPLHVVQRGNNRESIFCAPGDISFFKECLAHSARRHGVAIHAYVLMTNHVHLLVTPALSTSLPRMMQAVGRVYVQYFNGRCRRTGTLWEGRYKAAIVDSENYLLTCMRYIELNPVRARMTAGPGDYPWSSFRAHAWGAPDALLSPHSLYQGLGRSVEGRQAAYRALFRAAIPAADLCAIRDATQNAWVLGSAAFRREIDASGRRAERLPMGRPPKKQRASLPESGV